MIQFLKDTSIDFIRLRKYTITFSIIFIIAGIISMIIQGGPRYGIDFEGGTLLQLKFEKDINIGDIRLALSKIELGESEIKKSFTGESEKPEVLIRVHESEEGTQTAERIQEIINEMFPDNKYEVLKTEKVGPKIGKELVLDAVFAILISMLGILIYVGFRFEFKFALGAIVGLFHNVLITLGLLSILDFEISMAVVAALLTLVGYSINDTIVVFDRIRENLKTSRKEGWAAVINKSINQTISRTIITGISVLAVLFILLLFGGEVLRGFSFTLFTGIIIGTYSSIFIASPIVLEWHQREEAKKLMIKK